MPKCFKLWFKCVGCEQDFYRSHPKNSPSGAHAAFPGLCNVLYKIVVKTIANHLKLVLPTVISEEQSAFVRGRLITDNAIIAYEIFHNIKNRRRGPVGDCTLKLDMSKAYDRVEWSFVEKMMVKLGFPTKLVSTILDCISTVSYFPLINGVPAGEIIPQRGG